MKRLILLTTLATSTAISAIDNQTLVKVIELTETNTAAIRIITTPEDEGARIREGLPKIMEYLDEISGAPTGAPYTRYFEFSAGKVDIEIGFPVKLPVSRQNTIYPSTLPGGSAATILHIGPYEQVGPSYEQLNEWMTANHRQLLSKPWEVSLNDPRATTPDKYETLIVFPIE